MSSAIACNTPTGASTAFGVVPGDCAAHNAADNCRAANERSRRTVVPVANGGGRRAYIDTNALGAPSVPHDSAVTPSPRLDFCNIGGDDNFASSIPGAPSSHLSLIHISEPT